MDRTSLMVAASAGFFLLGAGALVGAVVAVRTQGGPRASVSPPSVTAPARPGTPTPPAQPVPPATPVAPAQRAEPVPPALPPGSSTGPIVPPPPPPDGPAPAVAPSPPAAPAESPRPMRPALGISVGDVPMLDIVELGSHSVSVGDRAPKITSIMGGTPASEGGLHVGERVFSVDGRPVDSAAEFEAAFNGKTIPGQVVLRTGPTYHEAHDVRIIFK